jgi:hypothetical protein
MLVTLGLYELNGLHVDENTHRHSISMLRSRAFCDRTTVRLLVLPLS